jgi:putative acetyltransferase
VISRVVGDEPAPEDSLAQTVVVVRRAVAYDASAIGDVVTKAFGDEGPVVTELVVLLQQHRCGRDGLSFVAVADDIVVGHVLVTRSRLDTMVRTIDVGVLSPLAVDERWRGRGVARALVAAAVTGTQDTGLPLLFLEGDPAFYARLGFVAAGPLGFRKPSLRIPDAAFQVMHLSACEPWMTGTLVYAEPFWDLDCVGLRDPH